MRVITTTVSALVIMGLGTGGALAATADSESASVVPASAALAAPAPAATPINFAPGADRGKVSGTLPRGEEAEYVFTARAGQQATIVFNRSDSFTRWELTGPDGTVLHDFQASPVSTDTVELAVDGDYRITVNAGKPAAYNLTLTIPGAPSQDGTPAERSERISFAPGTDTATFDGGLADKPGFYIFRAAAGQTAQFELPEGDAPSSKGLELLDPDGSEVTQNDAGDYPLAKDGEYSLTTTSAESTPYTVTLTIPAA